MTVCLYVSMSVVHAGTLWCTLGHTVPQTGVILPVFQFFGSYSSQNDRVAIIYACLQHFSMASVGPHVCFIFVGRNNQVLLSSSNGVSCDDISCTLCSVHQQLTSKT